MMIPVTSRATAVLAAWLALTSGVARARDPDPMLRIPLAPMGFQTLSSSFLLAGSSMLTVDFVDKDHLLVTFDVRRLMPRVVDDPPTDDDRVVSVLLVELPSGKVLARTEWRMHDRAQYLWNLGHGRFLLRVRDHLTMIAPREAVLPGDAFREAPFLSLERLGRRILAVQVSADDDLLTVETTQLSSAQLADPDQPDPAPVQLNFYRLHDTDASKGVLGAVSAGAIRTRVAVGLPITASGFLDVVEGGRDQWLFNFDTHDGKVMELAEWDTSCFPRPTLVGHGEFVAFGCRGGQDRNDLAGFNLKGEQMWQQNFSDSHLDPNFAFAPVAGRFALERTVVDSTANSNLLAPSQINAEEVRVFQTYNGRLLFRTECTPAEPAGQNFALSPDGMQIAVVRETAVRHAATREDGAYSEVSTAVEVYALPALSNKDEAAVKEAAGLAPGDTGARIDLSLMRHPAAGAAKAKAAAALEGDLPVESADTPATQVSGGSPDAGGKGQASVDAGSTNVSEGDEPPAAPRKPPTLYGPDERPKERPAEKTPQ